MRSIPRFGQPRAACWYLALVLFVAMAVAPCAYAEDSALMKEAKENPKAFKDLLEHGRSYFDPEGQIWAGRKNLMLELERLADEGKYPLKDLDFLRWFVYQTRAFEPPMTDRKWQKAEGISEAKKLPGNMFALKSEALTITFSVPKGYPKPKDFKKDIPRPPPYPLLLTMHEKKDFTGERFPGAALLKRRYPKGNWGDLYDQWLTLVPVAAAGNYLDKEGLVRSEVLNSPFSRFWKHYNVDFERVILDGDEQALTVASSLAVYFAGIIFRNKWELTDAQKATVKNFASVPVYVVDCPKLAQQLRDAGHPDVTAGISGPILYKWMNERRRVLPKKIDWNASSTEQVLPYWVNLDSPLWSAPERTVKVEVIDTEETPNTIRIEAVGVGELSLYLNDGIVDLDRKVRVEINGHVAHDKLIEPSDERMKKVGRDLDMLFNRDPVKIRKSMYFGWLSPVRLTRLEVRPPEVKEEEKPETPKDTGPKATAEEESLAKRYMGKVEYFEKRGNIEQAIKFIQLVLDLPTNKYTQDAQEKLAVLKPKSEPGAEK
jgi:hypothetical protein